VTFSGTAGTSGSAGPIEYAVGVAPPSNTAYCASGLFVADATGTLTISMEDTFSGASGIRLNGFELQPDPSSDATVLTVR
jgi:hypothetical protein